MTDTDRGKTLWQKQERETQTEKDTQKQKQTKRREREREIPQHSVRKKYKETGRQARKEREAESQTDRE